MIQDPALFVTAILVAVYAALCLACWAFSVKGARITPILGMSLIAAAAAAWLLVYAVRW